MKLRLVVISPSFRRLLTLPWPFVVVISVMPGLVDQELPSHIADGDSIVRFHFSVHFGDYSFHEVHISLVVVNLALVFALGEGEAVRMAARHSHRPSA